MKAAIYHRQSKLDTPQTTHTILQCLRDWATVKGYELTDQYLYNDVADKLEDQLHLCCMLNDAKLAQFNMVICYSPISLSNCSWPNMLTILEGLTENCGVKFVSYLGVEVNETVAMLLEWENQKASQRQLLIQSRGEQCGRPRKELDNDKMIDLRKQGLTMKAIGDKLNVSAAMIYRELPKELRGKLPKNLRMKMRKEINKK